MVLPIWQSWSLYNKDFVNAEQAAREAIQIAESDGYYLIDDYESIFSIDNEQSELFMNVIVDFGNRIFVLKGM